MRKEEVETLHYMVIFYQWNFREHIRLIHNSNLGKYKIG